MAVGRRGRRTAVLVGLVAVLVGGFAVVLIDVGDGNGGARSDSAPASPSSALRVEAGAVGDASTAGVVRTEPAPGLAAPMPEVPAPGVPVGGVQRALVRTAQVTVEVGDPAAGSRQIRTAVAAVGGFVTEEQASSTGAWVVLRVPAAGLDRLVEQVGGFGKVVEQSSQVVDATEEVVDLDARVASQQASVARIRALLAQAVSIADVVAIESELARREAELDSLTGRLAALRGQVELSTLTIDLRGTGSPPAEDPRAVGFGDGLAAGWDGLRTLGTGVAAVIGFLLPFLPVLAVLAGIGWAVRWLVRGRRAARPAPAGAGAESAGGS
ncbi:MAG: DUF4349 domain-containing protein [Pseudonocardia sp.]